MGTMWLMRGITEEAALVPPPPARREETWREEGRREVKEQVLIEVLQGRS